jgi:hypothetical protein
MLPQEICPFSIGDAVVYRPTEKGRAADVMSSSSGKLSPGQNYVVRQVQNDLYVVVEGYEHPGGGIYWTEFEQSR